MRKIINSLVATQAIKCKSFGEIPSLIPEIQQQNRITGPHHPRRVSTNLFHDHPSHEENNSSIDDVLLLTIRCGATYSDGTTADVIDLDRISLRLDSFEEYCLIASIILGVMIGTCHYVCITCCMSVFE